MIKIGDTTINPTKIICLGLNYQDHIDEFKRETPKEPVLFTKTLNCLITDEEPIIYPKILYNDRKNNQVDYEVELAFIIKDKCKNVPENEAYDHILGYTVFNDVTARKMQRRDVVSQRPWFKSKSFDTFGIIGPRIVPTSDIADPHDLNLELKLNSDVKQSSNTKHLIHKIPFLVKYISSFFTLEPGDIIATGTPSGIGPVKPGDIVEATVEKIGTLTNEVILEES